MVRKKQVLVYLSFYHPSLSCENKNLRGDVCGSVRPPPIHLFGLLGVFQPHSTVQTTDRVAIGEMNPAAQCDPYRC